MYYFDYSFSLQLMGGTSSKTQKEFVLEPRATERPVSASIFDPSTLFRPNDSIPAQVFATEDETRLMEVLPYGKPVHRENGRLAYASLVPSRERPGFFDAHIDVASANQFISVASSVHSRIPKTCEGLTHSSSYLREVVEYYFGSDVASKFTPSFTVDAPAAPVILPTCVNYTSGATFSYPHLFSSIIPMLSSAYIRNFATHVESPAAGIALRAATQRSGVLPLHNVISHLSYGFARSAVRHYRRETPQLERRRAFVMNTYLHTPTHKTAKSPIQLFTYYHRPVLPWVNIGIETFVTATAMSFPMHFFHHRQMKNMPYLYPPPSGPLLRSTPGHLLYTFIPSILSLAQLSAVDAFASFTCSLLEHRSKREIAVACGAATVIGSYVAALLVLPFAAPIFFRDASKLIRVGDKYVIMRSFT